MRSDRRGLGVPNLDVNLKAWEATGDSERGNSCSDLPGLRLRSRMEKEMAWREAACWEVSGREKMVPGGEQPRLADVPEVGSEEGWRLTGEAVLTFTSTCRKGASNCEAPDPADLFSVSGVSTSLLP